MQQFLHNFKDQMISTIWEFEKYWYDNHAVNPDNFPMCLSPEEWYERFLAWLNDVHQH